MLNRKSTSLVILISILVISMMSCNPDTDGTSGTGGSGDTGTGENGMGNGENGSGEPEEEITIGDLNRGLGVWHSSGCTACHHIGDDPGGDTGPALTGIGDRFTKSRIKAYILDPASVNPETGMPPQEMSDENAEYLARYLSLRSSDLH